jgi:shikimate kinase
LPESRHSISISSGASPRRKLACLAGFMGSGKTTVGKLLAAQLAWRFVDLDEEIERHAGLPIAEIFARSGEPAFRDIEHECLVRALSSAASQQASFVLALGGGTFVQPRNVVLLRDAGAVVLWLDTPVEELLARCVLMPDRPLFRNEASFRKLYDERLPFYRQADYRVPGAADPREAVERIRALGILDGDGPLAINSQSGKVIA